MTLTELMGSITSRSEDIINSNLLQFLEVYTARLVEESVEYGFSPMVGAGMLSGIASTLQFIGEHGIPSDLQEIMHGEKIK